jgi:glycosyltransferase involved in cell wall biosynthesis
MMQEETRPITKKMLVINKSQFGYHTDYLFFCKYLKTDFDLTYICMDYNHKKIDLAGITIAYVKRDRLKIARSFAFFAKIIDTIRRNPYDIILLYYFNYCSLIKLLFPRRCFVLDIRTTAIKNSLIKRNLWNMLLRFEAKLFPHITIISASLAQKTGLQDRPYHLLPLGADEISDTIKDFKEMNLLYVGNFLKRNIHETIEGMYYFYKEFSGQIKMSYTIIGFGSEDEIELIRDTIKKYSLEPIVRFVGQIPYTELKLYFDQSNIGVSYVPITEYFDCQPATKTFEYIMSGLFCISTCTTENRKVIKPENGILCNDTPESFHQALIETYKNRELLRDSVIRNSLPEYKWENIVCNNFKHYLNNLLHD